MKNRLKGLVSLWLAAVMVFSMMPATAMAAAPVDVMVYTKDTPPVPGEYHDSCEWVSLEFDTPLVQQSEIMGVCPIPAGGVLNGWRLWSANSGGLVYANVDPITIGKDEGISQSTWSSLADNINDYLMIEQLWTMKYRINPQPSKDNDYTVGGEVYDEANTTWSKADEVTYQWKKVTVEDKTYTVVGDTPTDDQIQGSSNNWTDGSWSSTGEDTHSIDIYIPVQVDDVVTVTFSQDFSGSVTSYDDGSAYDGADRTYTKTMTADTISDYDGTHNLYITDSAAFTATITVTRSEKDYTSLKGQTGNQLNTTGLPGGTYVCDVTFNPAGDNVTLTSNEVQVIGVTLTPATLTMTVGGSSTLTAAVTPDDAANKNVSWSSSNENVATVDQSGNVTAKSVGTATITVTTEDGGKTATCDVTVDPVAVTGVTLDPTTLELLVGESSTLTATVSPDNATDKTVKWTSSDEKIATVDQNGKVTAVKAGTATITATAGDQAATCDVTVVPTYKVTLDGNGADYDMEIVVISGETATEAYNKVQDPDVQDAGAVLQPTRDGYTFDGWYTDKDKWENKYDFTSAVTANTTVYAKWVAHKYVVQFEANGGEDLDVKGEMAPQNFVYGESQKLNANEFTCEGYTFIGWAEADTGEVVYKDKASVKNLTTTDMGTVTLYAQWKEKSAAVVLPGYVGGHTCTSRCDICGGCKDLSCEESVCSVKCRLLTMNFTDVPEDEWYTEAVEVVYHHGLMNGVEDGSRFDPYGVTNRAMVVTILWRLENQPTVNYDLDFEDVAEGQWYTQAVKWAVANGVALGYGDGTFGPMDTITREQLATMLYRYEQYKGGGFKGLWMFRLDYVDAADVAEWAYEGMCWATMNKVIEGVGGNRLNPKGAATRAELAQVLKNYLENVRGI